MKYEEVISNVNIYGLEESVKESNYPMPVDLSDKNGEITDRTFRYAGYTPGSGHDSFLNGIIVQFDLTFTNKAWVEAERFHFLDLVSSQSTMQRMTEFDLDEAYIEYTDPRIVAIMKEKVKDYNDLQEDIRIRREEGKDVTTLKDLSREKYLEILYSNPAGFRLTARMTTNYRQLKTLYLQRRKNRLPEWRAFCEWITTLPHSEFITGGTKE
jgi:hypothetical protein